MRWGCRKVWWILLWLVIVQPALAYDGDYILEQRFKQTLAAARDGDVKAQYAVAEMYRKGRGTPANDEEALIWYIRAAQQGKHKAAYKAGYLYLHSDTVSNSPKKALPWLKMAADTGYSPAQYELGLLYSTGKAGQLDNKKALSLLSQAKLAGHKEAEKAFDQVVRQMVLNNQAAGR